MRTTKVEKRLAVSQGNVFPSMLEELAKQLGVQASSLARLGLGWAPIVEFKKGMNYQGWWVVPERDAHGKPIGLSLRQHERGTKVMLPGSKHGLTYELNPEHRAGEEEYRNGAQNWARTMDAGVDCPVCGKPDGCLVSAENPDDPKAAVCIRIKQGAEKPLKFGHLHLLKDSGKLAGTSVLPASDDPVIIVEGMTDTAAAMDLGFVAVGRPSNLAGLDALCDLVRGRHVIIIGENDDVDPNTGKIPGHDGMFAAFQVLRRVVKSAKAVLPPEQHKDLRGWKKAGLDRDTLLSYVDEHGHSHVTELVLPDTKPLTAATMFLNDHHRMGDRCLLKHWRNGWYVYREGRYVEITPDALEAPLYTWADDKLVRTPTNKGGFDLHPVICNSRFVTDTVRAIKAKTLVEQTHAPCWTNGAEGPDPKDLIVFSNGILHVPSYLEGKAPEDYLLPSTPDLFTTCAMPFAFDPTAKCPHWENDAMQGSLGDDPGKIQLLREWMGYCMTTDTSMQKMMYMRGPSGAGKSMIMNVMAELAGPDQAASPRFADLAEGFALEDMIDKSLCTVQDARSGGRTMDNMRALEALLNIVGEDPVRVNRKNIKALSRVKLGCRVTIGSNEFLDLPDHNAAMLRRLLILEFTRSFADQPDNGLFRRLADEVPGIAIWALEGLRTLREQGYFTEPESSLEAKKEWRLSTSPFASFFEEVTIHDPQGEIPKDELFDAWAAWAMERGLKAGRKTPFFAKMNSAAPHAHLHTYSRAGSKYTVYRGIKMRDWASKKLLGRPTN